MKIQVPVEPFGYIEGEFETFNDIFKFKKLVNEQTEEDMEGRFRVHVPTDVQYEFVEETVEGLLKAKELYKYIKAAFVKKKDTSQELIDSKPDGTYKVRKGGEYKLLNIRTRQSGKNKGRLLHYEQWEEGDIRCQKRNYTEDLTQ